MGRKEGNDGTDGCARNIFEMAVQQCLFLSFGTDSRVGGCTLFLPETTVRGVLAGGCITAVSRREDEVTLTVAPALLRLFPLRLPSGEGSTSMQRDLPQWDAVALLGGLPSIRLKAVLPTFPVFSSSGGVLDNTVTETERERRAQRHLERLCAYAPAHLTDFVSLTNGTISAWFFVSYPGLDIVPDPCVFILPDVLVVRTAIVQVGFRAIQPHHRELHAIPALNIVRERLQKVRLPGGASVRVLTEMDPSKVPPLIFTHAKQMT